MRTLASSGNCAKVDGTAPSSRINSCHHQAYDSCKMMRTLTTARIMNAQSQAADREGGEHTAAWVDECHRYYEAGAASEQQSLPLRRNLSRAPQVPVPQQQQHASPKRSPRRYASPFVVSYPRCTSAPCRRGQEAASPTTFMYRTQKDASPHTRTQHTAAVSTPLRRPLVPSSVVLRRHAKEERQPQQYYMGAAEDGKGWKHQMTVTMPAVLNVESDPSTASKLTNEETDYEHEESKVSVSTKASFYNRSSVHICNSTNGLTDHTTEEDRSPDQSRHTSSLKVVGSQPTLLYAAVDSTNSPSDVTARYRAAVAARVSANRDDAVLPLAKQTSGPTRASSRPRKSPSATPSQPPHSPSFSNSSPRVKVGRSSEASTSTYCPVLSPMPPPSSRTRFPHPHQELQSPPPEDGFVDDSPCEQVPAALSRSSHAHGARSQISSPRMDYSVHSPWSGSRNQAGLFDCSFISSRSLLQGLVQRWCNRYEENKGAYREGGYLNVTPGKLLRNRYVIIQKLGWGEFSTVWLAYDTQHTMNASSEDQRPFTPAYVAIKIAKCHASVRTSTEYETTLLRYIGLLTSAATPITGLLDTFDVAGPYGSHLCMVMAVHGSNLLSVIDHMKAERRVRTNEERSLVKEMLISTLLALQELHAINVIHTDIKPENILCTSPDAKVQSLMRSFCRRNAHRENMVSPDACGSDGDYAGAKERRGMESRHLVCLADFGLSAVLEPPAAANHAVFKSAHHHTTSAAAAQPLLAKLVRAKPEFPVRNAGIMKNLHGTLIQTREYRAPEILLGMDFTCATDMWSVGCMAYELITGEFLMDPKKRTKDELQMDVEHMAMIRQLIGPVPPEIVERRTKFNAYFHERARSGAAAASRMLSNDGERPPAYIHRYINAHGEFSQEDRYRHYRRRCLHVELAPYLGQAEAKQAASFILMCLYSYDPRDRPSAAEMLSHPWLQELTTSSV